MSKKFYIKIVEHAKNIYTFAPANEMVKNLLKSFKNGKWKTSLELCGNQEILG